MREPGYPIETERLTLRPLLESDADALHSYQSRPDVCRYIPYEPRSHAEVVERLRDPERCRTTLESEGQAIVLAAQVRETGQVVGDIILIYRSAEHRCAEIGYAFHPDHAGHGYATEAARALLDLAFDVLDFHRVIGRVDARNEASAAVLRRAGLRQEAHLLENEWFKGEWTDEIDFAMLASERRAGR